MDSSIPIISRLLLEGLKPLQHLERNADTLFKEMDCLRAFKGDIQSHLVALETPQVKRSSQVETWMREVDSLNEEVGEIEESFIRRRVDCLGGCCSLGSLSANYHLGVRVSSMLRRVRDLNGQGSFTSLVDQPPPEMDQASSSVSVVGAEATLSAIREHLCNEHVKILGIYGMGGIGKTTLLSKIKNEMSVTKTQFDVVIWVTVSRDVNALNIQKTIREQLGLDTEKTKREQLDLNTQKTKHDGGAEILKEVLSEKKILLILDDVWERLDLEKMGVPLPSSENKLKIAITTRSEQVCISMGAHHKIKVPPLTGDESWELFREKVGVEVDINNPSILPHAKRVVAKCGGLPLTLVTVGRAMVDATTAEKWVEAIEKMGNPHDGIRGMRDVYSLLKFSYDGLENNTLRHCLLFCSLFAEDSDIAIDDLINLWVGEGILLEEGSDDCLNSARKHGHSVVNKLKAACLLGSGSDEELHVKLHDGVRDMILWISSGDWDKTSGDSDNLVLLSYAGLGLTRFPPVKRWGEARWISIRSNEIEEVPDEIPSCPKLLVLIMAKNDNFSLTKSNPDSFFTFMPILRVLDLSFTWITELPKSVGSLVELRLLDLSWSMIISLPEEIGNLAKLRILDLRETPQLAVVPRESILKLSSLQALDISFSWYTWDDSDGQEEIPHNNLKQLESLGLTIGTSHFLEKLLSYPVWSKAMESLSLNGGDMTSAMISRTCEVMKMLVYFDISNNDRLEEFIFSDGQLMKLLQLKLRRLPLLRRIVLRKEEDDEVVGGSQRCCLLPSLRSLIILRCHKLEELNWVSQLSSLTLLDLFNCPLIEELIVDECDEKEEETNQYYAPLLPNLITMNLKMLPNLKSISRRLLALPSLQYIHVSFCPKLKKLPFRNDSAKKIKLIRGTQRWWDELEWEEDNIRLTFFQHFTAS